MKSLLQLILLLTCCTILCSCPYYSPYGIDAEAQLPIDESLLGKWATFVPRPANQNDYKEEAVKIIFDKRTDQEYDIAITGYIDELKRFKVVEDDTIKGTAFLSLVEKRYFLNAFIKGKVYIAEVKKQGNAIDLLALAGNFTEAYVKSPADLRVAIVHHYKSRAMPLYDEWFVLKNLQKVK